jgi:hypothetical protein
MPAKSRRNRRPQTKSAISGQGGGNIATNSDSPVNTQTSAGQGNQFAASNNKVSRTTVPEAPVGSYFLTEVKWIAVVTAIIVILLIASYYIFR